MANLAFLIGRLTKDPDVRYTTGENPMAVCKFTLAIDDGYGEKKRTNFIPVVVFGKQAENCEKYLSKGSQVGVQGKIHTDNYTNREGQKVYTTDVTADRVEFLSNGQKGGQSEAQASTGGIPQGFKAVEDDEIPF